MDGNSKDFLGRGWSYPVAVNRVTGRVKMSEYEQDIAEAIKIILSTRRGERVMRPQFGSNLHSYVFALNNVTVKADIKRDVNSALDIWEPRIKDINVEVSFPEGQNGGFVIDISYVVRSTNNAFNLVYPFFITEGNN